MKIEVSDEQQGWEAWVGPGFGLLRLWWVWGPDLELKVEEGCQKPVSHGLRGREQTFKILQRLISRHIAPLTSE